MYPVRLLAHLRVCALQRMYAGVLPCACVLPYICMRRRSTLPTLMCSSTLVCFPTSVYFTTHLCSLTDVCTLALVCSCFSRALCAPLTMWASQRSEKESNHICTEAGKLLFPASGSSSSSLFAARSQEQPFFKRISVRKYNLLDVISFYSNSLHTMIRWYSY